MSEDQMRQISNYIEQKRIRDLGELGSRQLYALITALLDGGMGPTWISDTVNGIIEIWVDHHPEDDEEVK